MKFNIGVAECFQILLYCLTIYTSPLSTSSKQAYSETSSAIETSISKCEAVETEQCTELYSAAQLPNLFGHNSSKVAGEKASEVLRGSSQRNNVIIAFICTLYLPPCSDNTSNWANLGGSKYTIAPLPCRAMCELAAEEGQRLLSSNEASPWPVQCQTLPTENCFHISGSNGVAFVKNSIVATHRRPSSNDILHFAPIDVELGNDEGYEVEVVSLSANRIPERRYDIANLGEPDFFQGWTDVQSIGAANDYCRIVGKNKRRFMSCNLAGSTGQGHHYVSKLGFDAGYPNTWFMRDMDGDGRDDYCRCVGTKNNSKITCMKAGEHGFYGSTTQGGDQHTFSLQGSNGCFHKRFNPMFGEIVV